MESIVSSVNVYLFEKDGVNLKAFCDVCFAGQFVAKGFKIVDGKNGLFVSMPSQKNKNDEYQDTIFPITKESREDLISKVLEAYNKKLSESSDKTIENVDEKSIPF